MSKKYGTYKVTFYTGEQVIFGNNYKPWWQHATEFVYRNYGSKTEGWRYEDVSKVVKEVSFSNQQFYDDGGLKWCEVKGYQELIDKVSKQESLVPINAKDIIFATSASDKATLTKKLKEY